MWIAFSLLAAVGAAATSLVLKQTISHGGVVVSTVAFRIVAGILLTGVVVASGSWFCFALQQIGLHLALRATQAGYVVAVNSTSTEHMEEQRAGLPFLEAVVRQLAYPLGGSSPLSEREAREQVTELLRLAREPSSTGEPQGGALRAAEQMVRNPVLLSVVFQNIDLLYEHGYPGADALSVAVMTAVGELEVQP